MKKTFLLLFLFCSKWLVAQLTYETLYVDYDSAWQYKNMKLIPIRPKAKIANFPKLISLSAAMKQGIATVSERGTASTENVHWLRINNRSDSSIFISSGEILSGGRQDRVVNRDTILVPTGKDQYVSVMCAEEGRWSEREKKFIYGNFANLRLRKVVDQSKNQVFIWKEIYSQLDTGRMKAETLAYTAQKLDKKFLALEDDYFKFFQNKFKLDDSTIAGFVCVSGNRVVGCDIFAGTNLFYDELDPLLYGYIDEILISGTEPVIPEEKIKDYMHTILKDEISQEEYCKKNGKLYKYNNKVIHLTAY